MSGICAFWNYGTKCPVHTELDDMLAALESLGPDSSDQWSQGEIGLGRTLMRFVPEDVFDRQPLWSKDRTACLVADIRLDNRPELLRELGVQGDELSDAEVLMAAWTHWQRDCLAHVIGAFAFAVWTPATREIFAARDHGGECNLFFYRDEERFALASRPKALQALHGVGKRFYFPRFAEWLVLSHPEPDKTFFEGIERLSPGSWLHVTPDRLRTERYWHPIEAPPIRFKRDEDYAAGLREVLDRATESRLRSSGGVASQLSAGLDSSSVTASAATLLARMGRTLDVYTSVPRAGFDDPSYSKRSILDEGPFASEAASFHANIVHHPMTSDGFDLVECARAGALAMDEPVLNNFNWLWYMAMERDCRQRGIHVLLQGVWGNATISFEADLLSHFFRTGQWMRMLRLGYISRNAGETSYTQAAFSAFKGLVPASLNPKTRKEVAAFNMDPFFANPEFSTEYRIEEKIVARMNANEPTIAEQRRQFFERFDLGPVLAGNRALSGVDLRDPTGDKRVWDYCYGVPVEQYAIDGHTRSLVRRAMVGRLPDSTLSRYRAGHQGADWFITMGEALPALRREVERMEASPAARKILDLPRMRRLLNEDWPTEGFGTRRVMDIWKYGLMRAISLGIFLIEYDPEIRGA